MNAWMITLSSGQRRLRPHRLRDLLLIIIRVAVRTTAAVHILLLLLLRVAGRGKKGPQRFSALNSKEYLMP